MNILRRMDKGCIYMDLLNNILLKQYWSRIHQLEEKRLKFAHYTSATAACSIIENNEIWLRNARNMGTNQNQELADPKEFNYGIKMLHEVSLSEAGLELQGLLRAISNRLDITVSSITEEAKDIIYNKCYLLCLTEHAPEEDKYGRQEMWKNKDVAFVFNNDWFTENDVNNKMFMVTNVEYFGEETIIERLKEINAGIKSSFNNIKSMYVRNSSYVTGQFINMFLCAILGLKTKEHREEREWRIIYVDEPIKGSYRLQGKNVSLGSKNENICMLELKNDKYPGIKYISLEELIYQIIVKNEIIKSCIIESLHRSGHDSLINRIVVKARE